MQKIVPHLWFDDQAADVVKFYTSVFRNGKIISKAYYPEAGQEIHGQKAGSLMTVEFEIENYRLIALNAGPIFTPNPSISFFVYRSTKEEIDELWTHLSEGGIALMPLNTYSFSEYYGWIQDKYGISWQIMLLPANMEVPPIMPSLLFTGDNAGRANEAIDFYVSVFRHSKRDMTATYGSMSDNGSQEPDDIAYADFELEGQRFAAMDSRLNHGFSFSEAISFLVTCKDQEEIDYYWEKLSADPQAEQCGWLKDKYGVSWQIVPSGMEEFLNNADPQRANRAMNAMLQMKKIDINALKIAQE